MAKNAITKTVGVTEVTFTSADITVPQDQYWVHCPDTNAVDVWVNLDPAGTTTAVSGDNHTFVRPGESVPFDFLPLKMIASSASQSATVGRY